MTLNQLRYFCMASPVPQYYKSGRGIVRDAADRIGCYP